jgi:hypothetical protein
MTPQEEKALEALSYIAPIFDRLGVRWCIVGGFACRVHGVDRPITDIDIDIAVSKDDPAFGELMAAIASHATSPLEHFVDQNYDLYCIEVMGILDICTMPELNIFDRETGGYRPIYDDGFPKTEIGHFHGLELPLMAKELIVKNKEALFWQRTRDLSDVAGLKRLMETAG